jgi:hypothetical protein
MEMRCAYLYKKWHGARAKANRGRQFISTQRAFQAACAKSMWYWERYLGLADRRQL